MLQDLHTLSMVFPDPSGAVALCRFEGEDVCWLESYTLPGLAAHKRSELGAIRYKSHKIKADESLIPHLLGIKPEWVITDKDNVKVKDFKESRLRYMGQSIARYIDALCKIHTDPA